MALPDIRNRMTTPAIRRIQEQAIGSLWFICAIFAVLTVCFILGYLFYNGYPAFVQIGLKDFLFGLDWNPTGSPPSYGILSLIVGTILVMIGAMVLAVPLGIASAIFISELAGPRLRTIIKPAVELLAGIPSVVYGFFGLLVLTNWIRVSFDVPTGETWLAGSILLGIMALPTIVSVSEDAINAVPREFKEGSLAIGATGWQTISKVIIPSALSGITAAVILGIGRAIGETMAVLMVTGNAAVVPEPIWNVLSPIRTLTATLGIETGEVPIGSLHYNALFAIAVVLLIITLLINLSATFILNRIRYDQTGSAETKRLFSQDTRIQIRRFLRYGCLGMVLLLVAFAAGILPCLVLLVVLIAISILWKRVSPKITQKIAYSCMFAAVGIVLAGTCHHSSRYHRERTTGDFLGIHFRVSVKSRKGWRHLPGDCRDHLPGNRGNHDRTADWYWGNDLSRRIYQGRPGNQNYPDRSRSPERHSFDRIWSLWIRISRHFCRIRGVAPHRVDCARPHDPPDHHTDQRRGLKEYSECSARREPGARGLEMADHQESGPAGGSPWYHHRHHPLDWSCRG